MLDSVTEVRIEGVRASTADESVYRPASISASLTRYVVTTSSQIVRMNKGARDGLFVCKRNFVSVLDSLCGFAVDVCCASAGVATGA